MAKKPDKDKAIKPPRDKTQVHGGFGGAMEKPIKDKNEKKTDTSQDHDNDR